MEFTVERDELLKAVAVASQIVERRNTIPILANLLLKAKGDTLTITGTDLDVDVSVTIPAQVVEAGATTIPQRPLSAITERATGAFRFRKSEDWRVNVVAGDAEFNLHVLDAKDFPLQKLSGGDAVKFSVPAVELCAGLESVRHAISTEETRFYLNGVYFHPHGSNDHIRLAATNGHQLAYRDLQSLLPRKVTGIIPRRAVTTILSAFRDADADLQITVADLKMQFVGRNVTVLTKLIDGTYPDYQRVIPTGHDRTFTCAVSELTSALRLLCAITADDNRATVFAAEPDGLTLSMPNPDTGDGCVRIAATLTGEPIRIAFNPRFVQNILATTGGTVEFAMSDPASPALISCGASPNCKSVLMPMRAAA